LLEELLDDLFQEVAGRTAPDNADVEYKSGGLKDLLKSGFSLFVNVRKPRPSDNPAVLIYVCGGIRPDEVGSVRNFFATKGGQFDVLVASSHLISARDSLHFLLKK